MIKIQFPQQRLNVKEYFKSLSNRQYQEKVWLHHEIPEQYDSFDDAIAFLFDIAGLEDELETNNTSNIGVIFYDEEEAFAASQVIRAINQVLIMKGLKASDLEYMNTEQWPDVLSASEAALRMMEKNDLRCKQTSEE